MTPQFVLLPPPTGSEVARVLAGTARRLHRLLQARLDGEADSLVRDEPLLALLAQASLRSRIATGPEAGQKWRREGDRVEASTGTASGDEAQAAVARHAEMSLHAAVAVPARDRRRLERLCRYVARPPLACDRLEERPDGRLALRLKSRWRDGTTHILMQRRDLLDRLVPLIPTPRAHQVRYHGILAPGASMRDQVVPTREEEAAPDAAARPSSPGHQDDCALSPIPGEVVLSDPDAGRCQSRRIRWAALLQRVFAIDAPSCPRCGSTLRLVAAIEDPAVARAILECMGLTARAPPETEASPEDQAPSPEEAPSFSFDQSSSYEA